MTRTPIPTASPTPSVTPAALIHITSQILPGATLHQAYSTDLVAAHATGDVTWQALGPLPDGLFLSDSGTLHGRALQTGSFEIRVGAGIAGLPNASNTQDSTSVHLEVTQPAAPLVSLTTLPPAQVGVPYRGALDIVGARRPTPSRSRPARCRPDW